ncbi:MAG: chemotaxis protein CheD [Planctomycetia bacterium]|nr:chemotaxis protein CheD [Planctomycetia bacterium]
MRISNDTSDLLVTHGLGSCLGIVAYDPVARIGGLLHAMLPTATLNPEKARLRPFMFVDTGVRELLRQMVALGATVRRMKVKVAGGASMQTGEQDRLAVGKRNYLMLKKALWQHDLLLDAEDVGGSSPRTLYLEVGTGQVRLSSLDQHKSL